MWSKGIGFNNGTETVVRVKVISWPLELTRMRNRTHNAKIKTVKRPITIK